ncbi:MAG: DEAD/DEAH box helicase [Planctomycetota bacterium]
MQKHPELPQAFADLGIEVPFLKALAQIGFTQPSVIQEQLIPVALTGRDVLGQARTGTGKTAAFGLPVLQRIDPAGRLQAICLVPTRELAVQVTAELQRFTTSTSLHIIAVYGGQKIAAQLHQLGRKPHFVVGTPGRVLDFLRRGSLQFNEIRFAILDEVDRMLDIGFRDDIKEILGRMSGPHQTIFVSATLDGEIKTLARRYMNDPIEINVSQDRLTVDEVDQSFVTVEGPEKFRLLRHILTHENPPITIVFCNTKAAARKLAKKLFDAGIDAKEIHGDLLQDKRERIMAKFRKHQLRVLVATDLASRGIDVSAITHIINYDVPPDPQVYVHRVGRTARMGARGTAIMFVKREEGKELTAIEMLINRQLTERIVTGFEARPAAEPQPAVTQALFSRYQASASPNPETQLEKPLAKTLGSKFRPSRGRRR